MNERISVLYVASEQAVASGVASALEAAAGRLSVRPVTAEAARREPADGAVDCIVYADHAVGDADLRGRLAAAYPEAATLTATAGRAVEIEAVAGVRGESSGESAGESGGEARELGGSETGERDADGAAGRNAVDAAERGASALAARIRAAVGEGESNAGIVDGDRSFVEDAFDVAHVGLFVLDAAFSVVWANRGIERFFGVDRDGLVGRDKRTLIEERLKSVFADPEAFAERVTATYDDNSYVERFECHVRSAEGREERWLEHWSYPIEHGTYAGGRIEHYIDITERKARESELRAERGLLDRILKTSPIGIVILDAEGRIDRANEQAEATFGLTEARIAGRTYDDPDWRIRDADGDPIPSEELPVARVLATGEPVYGFEHAIVDPAGEEQWLSVNAAPITDADGSIRRVVCTVVDITDDRAAECRLAEQNERLAEFASIVSHDLRNPLNVVGGSLELAAETGEADHFERARRGLNRMEDLIADLLVLAREGHPLEAAESLRLGDVVAECWGTLPTNGATLEIETERVVEGDRSRLRQLFENLFRNSIEHGGSSVTITVGDTDEGFYVADDGPGVAPAIRENLFERGSTTSREGTGLGLYIVTQVAEAHGWSVELADTDGGTRIEFGGLAAV